MIYRRNEGDNYRFGLNWMSNKNTLFALTIVCSTNLILPTYYTDFMSCRRFHGWRIKVRYFRIRIRRWKNFPLKTKKVLWSNNYYLHPVGKQTFISQGSY